MKKTNVMRLLEQASIPYETVEYEVDENDLSGIHVARQTGLPAEQLFKTLVAHGEKLGYLVFCIPANQELDLKKTALALHDKKIELIPVKELLSLTGYIRGGCSPVGMKKKFPTYFDQTALKFEKLIVSAGVRGCQLIISRSLLLDYLNANVADIIV